LCFGASGEAICLATQITVATQGYGFVVFVSTCVGAVVCAFDGTVNVLLVLRLAAVISTPTLHAFTLAALAYAVIGAVVWAHLVLAGVAIEARVASTLAVVTDAVEATVERTRLE